MKIYIFLISIVLVGCALPSSEQALISKQRVKEICHSESLDTTLEKVVPKLSQCYNRSSSVPVYTGTGYTSTVTTSDRLLEKPTSNESRVFIVVSNGKYHGLRVKFDNGELDACPTKVTIHTMNFAWERHANRVSKWLRDPTLGCQIL